MIRIIIYIHTRTCTLSNSQEGKKRSKFEERIRDSSGRAPGSSKEFERAARSDGLHLADVASEGMEKHRHTGAKRT